MHRVIPGHVVLSELTPIPAIEDLEALMDAALSSKLEGLVCKDAAGVYAPAARHWLKVKKDNIGSMADSADLVVLGAYLGTGSYGGKMSVFILGCRDEATKMWCTVCKCGNGFTDAQMADVEAKLTPIMTNIGRNKALIPSWLNISSKDIPDFVAKDPK